MPTTTKGLQLQKTGSTEAVDGMVKGQPTQGVGPLLGAGGATMSTADDTGAKSDNVETDCGDPVNALTGDVIDEATDLDLPGVIPVSIARNYSTVFRGQPSVLGVGGWVLNLEQWIEPTESGLRYREANGRHLDIPAIAPGAGVYVRSKRYQVDCLTHGVYRLTEVVTGHVREFSTMPGGTRARLRKIVDARSNHVDLYYENGRLSEVVDTAKRRLVFSSDELGRVTQIEVVAQGKTQTKISYGYHPDGELAYVEDALGHRQRFEYDGAHRLTKKTLKNGLSFYYRYELETGKCIKTWGDGGLHEYEFIRERKEDHILVTTIGTEEPRTYKFNFAGDLLEEATFDRMFVEKKTYDGDHYVLSESNAAGETTSHEYDERGNRTKVTDPAGNVSIWEYEQDRPARLIGADGLETKYWHNGFGDLAGVRYPTGAEFSFEYDEYGHIAMIFGPDGTIARFAYDEQHNTVEEHDARGAVWRYTYDPLGRPVTRTDPLGAITRVEYDPLGQPIRVAYPDGSVTETKYDAVGNVAEFLDPQGQITQMQYMGTGSLVSQRVPDGTEWKFEYDTMERLRSIKNPKFETYRFFYDRAGRVEREETFDGRLLRYTYDKGGRLLRLEQADLSYRRLVYDPLGNVIEEDSPHGAQKYERDQLGRLMVATVSDGPEEIQVTFKRDVYGRIIQEQQGEHLLEFAFDKQGRRHQRVVPGCGKTQYHYDASGALSRIQHEAPSGATQDLALDRDILGREIARRSQDGQLRVEQAYDSMDRLIEQKIQAPRRPGAAAQQQLSQRKWRYDLAGRVQQIEDSRWGSTTYQYDQLGQLTSARRGQLHEVFDYQANGSLVRALNELVPEDSLTGPNRWDIGKGNILRSTDRFTYEYDRCHRRSAKIDRQTDECTEYIWDCRDRLREVRLPDGRRARYFYDAFGRRVRKEVTPNPARAIAKLNALGTPAAEPERVLAADLKPEDAFGTSLTDALQQLAEIGRDIAPRVTYFLWDGDELAAELDSETGPRGHVHYPGTFVPLLQIERGEIFVVVTDHLGTPRDLLGGDGTVRWSAAYTAWGKIHDEYSSTNSTRGPPTSEVRSPFRLLGQYYDEETGLSATRFRMWEAETGRWLSPDPLGVGGGKNVLGFEEAPTNDTDPLGLECDRAKALRISRSQAQQLVSQLGKKQRPGAVAVLVVNGRVFIGVSRSQPPNSLLGRMAEAFKARLRPEAQRNYHGNCAEVDAINKAISAFGSTKPLNGAVIATRALDLPGTPTKVPCKVCTPILSKLGIEPITDKPVDLRR